MRMNQEKSKRKIMCPEREPETEILKETETIGTIVHDSIHLPTVSHFESRYINIHDIFVLFQYFIPHVFNLI